MLPIEPVPKRCMKNMADIIVSTIGTTGTPGDSSCRPSMADVTVIAGVITPSAMSVLAPQHGQNIQPSAAAFAYKGEQCQHAALAMVVGTQRYYHIFERGLQRQRPYNTRYGTKNISRIVVGIGP